MAEDVIEAKLASRGLLPVGKDTDQVPTVDHATLLLTFLLFWESCSNTSSWSSCFNPKICDPRLSLGSCLKLAFDSKARCDRCFLTGDPKLTTVSESVWLSGNLLYVIKLLVTVSVSGVTVLIRPFFSFLLGALLRLVLSPQEDGLGVWGRDAAFFCGTWAFSPCPLVFSCYPSNWNKWCWTK